MKLFSNAYRDRRVLVTGHTGFKGSWLTLWLKEMGAKVIGVSLPPKGPTNHWDLLKLKIDDRRLDIRDFTNLQEIFQDTKPEIVFHLAAQPLVRRSYREPLETWSSNVMGTANIIEACRFESSVRAIVAITTDKCYENQEWTWGYRENDRLGGHDPYSASKAGAELVAASYRSAFFAYSEAPLLATARAGNVIGGGDWSEDRLIPDLIRALENGKTLEIRSPHATRPWQHVLESLSGYLLLGEKLLAGKKEFAEAWNFGPKHEGNRNVAEVLTRLEKHLKNLQWDIIEKDKLHEATLLYLDSSKSCNSLKWESVWNFDSTVAYTASWYKTWLEEKRIISHQQLFEYIAEAERKKVEWTKS